MRIPSGLVSTPWNLMPCGRISFSQPVRPQKKSRCHQERRYSPSVTSLRPTSCCLAMMFDLAILDRLELGRRDLALLALLTRHLDGIRTQETADLVGTKRRLGALWHVALPGL